MYVLSSHQWGGLPYSVLHTLLLLFHLAPIKSDVEYKETTDDEEVDVGEKFVEVIKELLDTDEKIRPKILFTPNNSLTWRIIKRVSYKQAILDLRILCEKLVIK